MSGNFSHQLISQAVAATEDETKLGPNQSTNHIIITVTTLHPPTNRQLSEPLTYHQINKL
jgi:hypothetical protein